MSISLHLGECLFGFIYVKVKTVTNGQRLVQQLILPFHAASDLISVICPTKGSVSFSFLPREGENPRGRS